MGINGVSRKGKGKEKRTQLEERKRGRSSICLYRHNLTAGGAFSEAYGYDPLNQLASYQRGTDSGQHTIPNPTLSQSWATDGNGNLTSLPSATGQQTLAYNAQNEISTAAFTSDADGNLTADSSGKTYSYDAWNRLVQVKQGSTVVASYQYDGLNRRIVENSGSAAKDLFYSSSWQVLEERVGTTTQDQYVWSPVYVDALVLRDRTVGSQLNERLYAQQDANWDVTALVDTNGVVVERYADDPYGQVTFLTASWSSLAGSGVAWVYQHQGGRLDTATGKYAFRHRDLDPVLDRWLEVDTERFRAGDTNFYRDTGDNPTNATDPLGLDEWRDVLVSGYGGWLRRENQKAKELEEKLKRVKCDGLVIVFPSTDPNEEYRQGEVRRWEASTRARFPYAKIAVDVTNLSKLAEVLSQCEDKSIKRLVISGHDAGFGMKGRFNNPKENGM